MQRDHSSGEREIAAAGAQSMLFRNGLSRAGSNEAVIDAQIAHVDGEHGDADVEIVIDGA